MPPTDPPVFFFNSSSTQSECLQPIHPFSARCPPSLSAANPPTRSSARQYPSHNLWSCQHVREPDCFLSPLKAALAVRTAPVKRGTSSADRAVALNRTRQIGCISCCHRVSQYGDLADDEETIAVIISLLRAWKKMYRQIDKSALFVFVWIVQ